MCVCCVRLRTGNKAVLSFSPSVSTLNFAGVTVPNIEPPSRTCQVVSFVVKDKARHFVRRALLLQSVKEGTWPCPGKVSLVERLEHVK